MNHFSSLCFGWCLGVDQLTFLAIISRSANSIQNLHFIIICLQKFLKPQFAQQLDTKEQEKNKKEEKSEKSQNCATKNETTPDSDIVTIAAGVDSEATTEAENDREDEKQEVNGDSEATTEAETDGEDEKHNSDWSPKLLLQKLPNLSLIIDLTNTNKYYNGMIISHLSEGRTRYEKLKTEGHVVPSKRVVNT